MQEPPHTPKDEQETDPVKPVGTEVQEKDETARGEPETSAPGAVPTPEQAVDVPKEEGKVEQATAPAVSVEPVAEPAPLQPEAQKSAEETPAPEAIEKTSPIKPQPVTTAVQSPEPEEKSPEAEVAKPATAEDSPQPEPIKDTVLPSDKPAEADVPEKAPPPPVQTVEAVKPDSPAPESKPEAPVQSSVPSAPSEEATKASDPPPATQATSAAVEALEKSARVAEAEAEAAGKAAVKAVEQASNLARAAAVPYEPPLPVSTQLGQPPAGAATLEAKAAAVSADLARRQQAVEAYRSKVEEEQKQKAAHAPEHAQQPSYDREESLSPRAMPPRRAASARAAHVFKKDADDYLSESGDESPAESPRQKKAPPKPKPQLPAAKPAQSKDSGASAWEEPPQKQLVLKMSDITKALQKKWLQLYWPDDGKWWPCQVVFVDPRKRTANVLYETGEEEADLGLAELVQKGEVAWLNASDAHKEVDQPGRGRKPEYDDDEEEEDEEDAWAPGRKRRAAAKSSAKYDESEPESSESESPPPSDQSSDWRSSEDDDKPTRKRPKKKRRPVKPPPRMAQQSHHHHSQSRDRHGGHGDGLGRSSLIGRGSIFDDTPEFGRSFGGGNDALRSQVQQRNPSMGGRDQMQGWGGMGGQQKSNPQYPGNWNRPSQGLDHMLQQQQNRQQMNNGNMGQLHIPQATMQGGQMMDIARFQQVAAAQGMRPGAMGWRPQGGADSLRQDWASMQANPLFRQMQQMGQHSGQQVPGSQGLNIGGHNLPQLAQQQMLQQQLMQQRMQQQQTQQAAQAADAQRAGGNLGSSTKNMEGIVAQGLNVSGKTVEVQQANGQWSRGTIMATMARGPQGGSALVHFDTGEQKQLSVNDEGRTYNIRMA